GSEDMLDQHSGFNGSLRNSEQLLRSHKDIVPQARLQVVLHLGEIKIRSASTVEAFARVVEKIEREIEQTAGGRLAINLEMLFGQVPAAGSDQERRHFRIQPVLFAVGARELNGTTNGVPEVLLAVQRGGPSGRMGVFEVSHVTTGAAVEGVDNHL